MPIEYRAASSETLFSDITLIFVEPDGLVVVTPSDPRVMGSIPVVRTFFYCKHLCTCLYRPVLSNGEGILHEETGMSMNIKSSKIYYVKCTKGAHV